MTGFDGHRPQPGDAGLCIVCGEFMIFDDSRRGAHTPTLKERQELDSDPRIKKMQDGWKTVVMRKR